MNGTFGGVNATALSGLANGINITAGIKPRLNSPFSVKTKVPPKPELEEAGISSRSCGSKVVTPGPASLPFSSDSNSVIGAPTESPKSSNSNTLSVPFCSEIT